MARSLAPLLYLAVLAAVSSAGIIRKDTVVCKSDRMLFKLNFSSPLFGPTGKEYDVEIEDKDINHNNLTSPNPHACPKFSSKEDPFIPDKSYQINFASCGFNMSKVYDGKDDVTMVYFNHHFEARSVNKSTGDPVPGLADYPFMVACYYQVKGDVTTGLNISETGNDNGQGSVKATDDIDMWITDRNGRNITGPVAYGTPLTLNMALNGLGKEDYNNIAPQFCQVAHFTGAQNPIVFVDKYNWIEIIFNSLRQLEDIYRSETARPTARYVNSTGTPEFTYHMDFTAFSFGGPTKIETLEFYCVFRLCIDVDPSSSGACDRVEQRIAYPAGTRHKRSAGFDALDDTNPNDKDRSKNAFLDVLPEQDGILDNGLLWYILLGLLALFLLSLCCCCCCCAWRFLVEPMMGGQSRSHSHCHGHGCGHQQAPAPIIMPVPMAMPPVAPSASAGYSLPSLKPTESHKGQASWGVENYLRGLDAERAESEFGDSRRSLVHSTAASTSTNGLRRHY